MFNVDSPLLLKHRKFDPVYIGRVDKNTNLHEKCSVLYKDGIVFDR